jgi:hypothetical protein
MRAMYPNGSVPAVIQSFAPQLPPPRRSSCSRRQHFEPREGRVGQQRRAFRAGLYTTKAVASAATPPKKYLRADYCCKNQEPRCYGHLFILVFRREPGRCLLRPAAEGRLSPTKRSRKSLVARTASARPALLVQRGNLNGIDRQRLGTAQPTAVAPWKRPASLSVDPISGIPTSNMGGEWLTLSLVPNNRETAVRCAGTRSSSRN